MPAADHTARMSSRRSPAVTAGAALLILAMAIGSVAMWIGAPLGWVYVASKMASSSQPELGPYVLVLFAVPITMVIIARGLRALDRRYAALVGVDDDGKQRAPWLRSMRDTPDSGRRTTVLDIVMVGSVGLALVVMAIWFFAFAGSSLPR